MVVGTGSAVSPVASSACLRKVGDETDPTITPPFDGLKRFRLVSCQAWFSDRARFGRSFSSKVTVRRLQCAGSSRRPLSSHNSGNQQRPLSRQDIFSGVSFPWGVR
jgi:hypothetical protein